jgi:hypothetical protein
MLVIGVALALVAVVLVLRACGGGSDAPPAAEAIELMPDSTLVFASLSTDGDRAAVERAGELARRFAAYEPNRDALLKRLSGGEKDVDADRDVAPWLGDEAAFALVDNGQSTAGSIVAIQVTDEDKAREFLARNPRKPVKRVYKGIGTERYGQVTTAFVRGFLVIGQDPTVQAAIDRDKAGAEALATDATYKRALEGLPDGRVVTAYASADGLRRLLAPQGSVLGALSTTLDQPGLQGVALAVAPEGDDKVRVHVHSALEPGRKPPKPFEPKLVDDVPADALGYLGARSVGGALQSLILSAAGGGAGSVLERLREGLDEETGGGLERDLLKLFEGEVAVVVQRQTPAPILTILAPTEDENRTRGTLDRLREPLAKLLRPQGEAAPTWKAQDVEGADAWTLTLPNGAAVTYAVAGGRLILSSSPEGVRRIVRSEDSLADAKPFEAVLSDRPETVGTLGFLDFSQLLELGEQTGLNDSPAYLAIRDDLRKVRAIGVSSTGGEGESTAEILVSIP